MSAPAALSPEERDTLAAASRTALVRVQSEFRPLCRMSDQHFSAQAVERLVDLRLLWWRAPGELAELTHAGRARLDLTVTRRANAVRFAELAKNLRAC